jgi:hypothetical protein
VVDRTALEMRHRCKPIGGSNPSLSATRLRLRFGAASRDEAQEKRVPRHSCEAATAGWFELSRSRSAIIK